MCVAAEEETKGVAPDAPAAHPRAVGRGVSVLLRLHCRHRRRGDGEKRDSGAVRRWAGKTVIRQWRENRDDITVQRTRTAFRRGGEGQRQSCGAAVRIYVCLRVEKCSKRVSCCRVTCRATEARACRSAEEAGAAACGLCTSLAAVAGGTDAAGGNKLIEKGSRESERVMLGNGTEPSATRMREERSGE